MFTTLAMKHFKKKTLINSSYYSKHKVEEKRVDSLWKLSKFYTVEFVDSYFHLRGRGYDYDCVDADIVVTSTANVD
jgi:hypothetical protein